MSKIYGLDPGTAFVQVAEKNEKGEIIFKTIRNVFVELSNYDSDDIEQILKQNKWQYVKDKGHYYVIGSDSMKISQIFPEIEIRRPMKNGILNKGEEKKMLIMASIIESVLAKTEDDRSVVCYCVSSDPIDGGIDSLFHKNRIAGMIKGLGFIPKCIDEGMGILFSERPCVLDENGKEIPYSGIAISLGAGRSNAVLAYKGLQVIGMSCNRGGDYIDQKVSEQTNFPLSQVVHTKEKKLDFNNIDYDDDLLFALEIYYKNLIEYIFLNFTKKFKKVKSQFPGPIDIVIGGGTASPPGFQKKVETVIRSLELPFQVRDIKVSKDPCNSVVRGLLTQAIISQKRLGSKEVEKMLE